MNPLEAVEYLAPMATLPSAEPIQATAGTGHPFSAWLERQVAETNTQLIDSGRQLRGLALGETENLHQVMMSLEKAKLSFELVLQVRNRLLEAYQDVMRIQV